MGGKHNGREGGRIAGWHRGRIGREEGGRIDWREDRIKDGREGGWASQRREVEPTPMLQRGVEEVLSLQWSVADWSSLTTAPPFIPRAFIRKISKLNLLPY
jgi:hypothetical protein